MPRFALLIDVRVDIKHLPLSGNPSKVSYFFDSPSHPKVVLMHHALTLLKTY